MQFIIKDESINYKDSHNFRFDHDQIDFLSADGSEEESFDWDNVEWIMIKNNDEYSNKIRSELQLLIGTKLRDF